MRQKGVTEMRPFVGALKAVIPRHPQDDLSGNTMSRVSFS